MGLAPLLVLLLSVTKKVPNSFSLLVVQLVVMLPFLVTNSVLLPLQSLPNLNICKMLVATLVLLPLLVLLLILVILLVLLLLVLAPFPAPFSPLDFHFLPSWLRFGSDSLCDQLSFFFFSKI